MSHKRGKKCAPEATTGHAIRGVSVQWLVVLFVVGGGSNLFTRDFFALGKRKLNQEGVWTQWLHVYGMDPGDLRALLATFASTYRHVKLFGGDGGDIILLGSDGPLQMRRSSIIDALTDNPAMAADLESVNMPHAEDVLAMYLMSRDILLELAGDVGLNTDDNMRIEYAAPLHLYDSTASANFRLLRRTYVVMPTFAMLDSNSWIWMSQAYARHNDSVRARLALFATKKPLADSRRAGANHLPGL